jgi:hypothetical protein
MPSNYMASRGFNFAEVIDWAVNKILRTPRYKAASIKSSLLTVYAF